MELPKEKLLEMYKTMVAIRGFEESLAAAVTAGVLPGFVHLGVGQEAVHVGVCSALRPSDWISSTHRDHGIILARGADIKRMRAEIFGKVTGYCKGKGGSMHIADFKIGMLGANGIVCAGLPISVGAALAAQLEGKGNVAVVFFGDGASNEGEFHECLNLAAVWNLPLIFACENNLYGANTPIRRVLPSATIAERAKAYAMRSAVVDGNDVYAVFSAAQEAIATARSGGGPSFLEFKTYRWHHHFEGGYFPDLRPPAEIEEWKGRCPLKKLEQRMETEGILDRNGREEIERKVMLQIEDAVHFAVESPYPGLEEALSGVYSE